MQLRLAVTEDRQRCIDLLTMLNPEFDANATSVFELLLSQERGQILVAEHDDKLVGMASVSFNLAMRYGGEYCQLEELIVDPAARGLNAGGALVQATIEAARQRGCAEYGLYLVESTEHNAPFYAKYGLVKLGSEMRMNLKEGVA